MTMNNYLSRNGCIEANLNDNLPSSSRAFATTYPSKMAIVEEEEGKSLASMTPISSSKPLSSRDSASSMVSWESTSTTDSTDSLSSLSSGRRRRRIFSEYWKDHAPTIHALVSNEEEEEEQVQQERFYENHPPRSPLLQHYPSSSGTSSAIHKNHHFKQQNASIEESPTSTIPSQDVLSTTKSKLKPVACHPTTPRRSIFGTAAVEQDEREAKLDLQRFFSRHEHMQVLSSSLDSSFSIDDAAAESTAFLMMRHRRRTRSYSCSDTLLHSSFKKTAAATPTRLPSCLKRRNSDFTPSTAAAAKIAKDEPGLSPMHEPRSVSLRRPSASVVTFDSQVEIVAFEAPKSYELADNSQTDDGSWTKIFQR